MPIAIKFKDADAVFTVSGMIALSYRQARFTTLCSAYTLSRRQARSCRWSDSVFKSLRLVGEMPPGFTAEDFHSVGLTGCSKATRDCAELSIWPVDNRRVVVGQSAVVTESPDATQHPDHAYGEKQQGR